MRHSFQAARHIKIYARSWRASHTLLLSTSWQSSLYRALTLTCIRDWHHAIAESIPEWHTLRNALQTRKMLMTTIDLNACAIALLDPEANFAGSSAVV